MSFIWISNYGAKLVGGLSPWDRGGSAPMSPQKFLFFKILSAQNPAPVRALARPHAARDGGGARSIGNQTGAGAGVGGHPLERSVDHGPGGAPRDAHTNPIRRCV